LLRAIGPTVAVVEVDHHAHASLSGPNGHRHRLLFAAMPVNLMIARVDKYPQAHRVDTIVLQEVQPVPNRLRAIVKRIARRLLLGQPADVASFYKARIRYRIAHGINGFGAAVGQEGQGGKHCEGEKVEGFKGGRVQGREGLRVKGW